MQADTDAPPLAPDSPRSAQPPHPANASDFDAASAFLEALAPGGEFCFQTFDDSGAKRPALAHWMHGSLAEHWKRLSGLNALGAGVFVTVNATDGQGRRAANITGVRGVFADFDTAADAGERLARVADVVGIEPSLVVESSPGKHHCYWLADELSLDEFTVLQAALARALGSDPVVKDLCRVMRLPGLVHRKDEPFTTRVIHEGGRTTAEALRAVLAPYQPRKAPPQPLPMPTRGNTTPYAQRALESAASAVLGAPVGARNDILNREAHGAFGLVMGGHLDEHEVRRVLERAAAGAGLSAGEIRTTLESAWRAATPREIPERPAAPSTPRLGPDTPAPLDLEPFKARHLLATEPPPQRYVVEGLIPEPIAAAVAAPGSTGKSYWLMQLAACVATGVPFMGQAIPEPGAVLMLGAEDDRNEMARRLHSIVHEYQWSGNHLDSDALGENFYPMSLLGQDNRLIKDGERNEAKIQQVINAAKAIPHLRLIILDPVSRFRAGEENSNDDNTRFAEVLEHIRNETGVTVLVAHHSRKGADGDSVDDLRGGSAFSNALRWVATLAKVSEDRAKKFGIPWEDAQKMVRFRVVKSNYRTDVDEQWMRRGVGGVLKLTDPPATPAAASQVRGDERYAETLPKLVELVRRKAEEGAPLTRRAVRDYAGQAGVFGVGEKNLRGIVNRALEERKIALHDNGTLHLW